LPWQVAPLQVSLPHVCILAHVAWQFVAPTHVLASVLQAPEHVESAFCVPFEQALVTPQTPPHV